MINIIIDGTPPSVNHYKGMRVIQTKSGRAFPKYYLTARAKEFKEVAIHSYHGNTITGTIKLTVKLYFDTHYKHDIDNYNKVLFDAFNGLLWVDDNQIVELHVYKFYDKEWCRTELEVVEIESEIIEPVQQALI